MKELYDVWDIAYSIEDLPPVPTLDNFEPCYQTIDVGYDCFMSECFAYGPYALIYDEEQFRRDTWGWSAQIAYKSDNHTKYLTAAHKCHTVEEAYQQLIYYIDDMAE